MFIVQATGEDFIPPKRKSSTSKKEISSPFSIFVGYFCLHGTRSGSRTPSNPDPIQIPIRIHNTASRF
jgi:hypothetical protein